MGRVSWLEFTVAAVQGVTVSCEMASKVVDIAFRPGATVKKGDLLVSQDVCMKVQLRAYGGFGYGHLLANVRELFGTLGGDEATWRTLTVENPARLLAWQRGLSPAR